MRWWRTRVWSWNLEAIGMLTRDEMRAAGLTAAEAIAAHKKGIIHRRFPGQYYGSRLEEIEQAATRGEDSARRALKLLFDSRFDK